MDNPTEITRSDVDTVIRTLADNNAYTIADYIGGEDKFGKLLSFSDLCHLRALCAEVKSWVIDLEFLAA
jgi:hypothetical protein